MFNSQAGRLLQRVQFVTATASGGIYMRMEENKALLELLREQAPQLMDEHPSILHWVQAQQSFLIALFEATHARGFLPAPEGFPRLMPAYLAPSAPQKQLQLEV